MAQNVGGTKPTGDLDPVQEWNRAREVKAQAQEKLSELIEEREVQNERWQRRQEQLTAIMNAAEEAQNQLRAWGPDEVGEEPCFKRPSSTVTEIM